MRLILALVLALVFANTSFAQDCKNGKCQSGGTVVTPGGQKFVLPQGGCQGGACQNGACVKGSCSNGYCTTGSCKSSATSSYKSSSWSQSSVSISTGKRPGLLQRLRNR